MQKHRIAVATFFFINGLLYANWTARIPDITEYFNINNTELGMLLLTAALGAIIAMPFAGWLSNKYGSDKVTRTMGLLFCCFVAFITISPNPIIASIFFFLMGFSTGAMDVAMNGQAVEVERMYQRPIMSSFHAVFSIGMAIGAGTGALFTEFEIALQDHFLISGILGILAILFAARGLLKDETKITAQTEEGSSFTLPTKAILPLGIIAFCGMTGEGTMADWSALFMNNVVGESKTFAAYAFGVFGVSMTIGRIFGDYFTLKLGKQKLLIFDSILAIIGLGIALVFASTWMTFLGFFLIGLGLSTIVPIVYSTAGNTEGVSPSVGIAMATTVGYAGFFIGPPVIGFLADAFGLRLALLFTLGLFVVMLLLILKRKF